MPGIEPVPVTQIVVEIGKLGAEIDFSGNRGIFFEVEIKMGLAPDNLLDESRFTHLPRPCQDQDILVFRFITNKFN